MKSKKEIEEKVDALVRDLSGEDGYPMDVLTRMFKQGAKTFGEWVLKDDPKELVKKIKSPPKNFIGPGRMDE